MPFGKFSGTPVEDVLVADRAYCTWLCQQPWFRSDYPNLHALFAQNGATPRATPRATPGHNDMQLRFLDDRWCLQLAAQIQAPVDGNARLREDEQGPTIDREFESRRGWDIRFRVLGYHEGVGPLVSVPILVECKTSIGDDFPEVLRQVKRRNEGDDRFDLPDGPRACVIVRAWNCQATPWKVVTRLFQSEHITLISEAWIGAA